jgi:hypothetical protein
MLNPVTLHDLESYGLTEAHLLQLLALCERGTGRATWHVDPQGIAKVEVTLFASRKDSQGMRSLTTLLQKDGR